MSEHGVEEHWQKVWEGYKKLPEFDSECNIIFDVLMREIGEVCNKKVLEAGSGSGRISAQLAAHGAEVTLLDTSKTAIDISKKIFAVKNQKGRFVNGSFFDAPFRDKSFDVVWNAGVLEHFTHAEQKMMLSELNRILKDGGLLITLNPSIRALLYRFGMWWGLRLGNWGSGEEFPISSLTGLFDETGFETVREYRVGFLEELRFLCHCPIFLPFTYVLGKIKRYKIVQKLNRMPGYVVVSVGLKR